MVSPTNPQIACSPDGLDTAERLGYEYKTKDRKAVPHKSTEILPCEFLQCMECLWCCQGIVDGWIICYNRLDTNEFKAFYIELDTDLMRDVVEPALDEFVRKVDAAEEDFKKQVEGGASIVFEEFMKAHLYPRVDSKWKKDLLAKLHKSMETHAHPIILSNKVYAPASDQGENN